MKHSVPTEGRPEATPPFRVSAIPGWHGGPKLAGLGGPPIASGGSLGFTNHGGPVIACPQIYAGFWGQNWYYDAGWQALAAQITQFLTDLPRSNYMNVLAQYGAGGGAGLAGSFFQGHTLAITGELNDQDVQNWIQILIDFKALPEPPAAGSAAQVMMIFLDETIGVNAPTLDGGISLCFPDAANPYTPADFGYHNFFTTQAGHPMYYGVIACCSDSCLQESCPDDNYCSLHLSQTQLQRMTQVASHEFSEILTDPQLNAWYAPYVGEIGDICNGEAGTITVSGRTWTVQKEYSLATDIATNGQEVCITSAANPLPLQSGAAMADLAAVGRYREGHLDRLLPLPMLHVDPQSRAVTVGPRQLRRFVSRIIHPLPHAALFPGLPSMLRQAADLIETPRATGPAEKAKEKV
jgi:hypothetical protein